MGRRRRKGKPVHGWFIIDKPQGMTSTAVVNTVKRLADAAKAGHGGTLDPLATGVLPVALDEPVMDELFRDVEANPGYRLSVDLEAQTVTTPDGRCHAFEVDEFKKYSLLNGLDEIGLTLQHLHEIRDYEKRRREEAPWLFAE